MAINRNAAINKHLGNISRAVGHDVRTKYSYIITESDLTNAYLQMRNDLGYPLQVDSRYRRAIIYNKQGLEKKIQAMINDCVESAAHNLSTMVVQDITNQLNSIQKMANGQFVATGGGSNKGSIATMIASAMGRGLVNGVSNIIDDMINHDDYERRR